MNNDEQRTTIIFGNTIYDKLKWIVQIVFPAIASAYFGLAAIYGWANAEQVVGTIAVATTFFGVLLGISSHQYHNNPSSYDGVVDISEQDGIDVFSLELNTAVEDIRDGDSFSLKVIDHNK